MTCVFFFLFGCWSLSFSQSVPERYGNNLTGIMWKQIETPHFKIVFPDEKAEVASALALAAERVYDEYQRRLSRSPDGKILLYLNRKEELVSGVRALETDEEYSIWTGDPADQRVIPGPYSLPKALRFEIAFAFKESIKSFPIDYYFYLFSRPSQSPWSDGFVSYLAIPEKTEAEINFLRDYGVEKEAGPWIIPALQNRRNTLLGRSQIRYFTRKFSDDSLSVLYNSHQSLFGLIPYFDYHPAFKEAAGISYEMFEEKWRNFLAEERKSKKNEKAIAEDLSSKGSVEKAVESEIKSYSAFSGIQFKPPFAIPYYVNGDFGLAGHISLEEPMRTHAFDYYGTLSFADPFKSFFYSRYVNNSFRPRIELVFNHFPSASGFFGKSRKVETTDVVALSSLWKLTGLSHNYSDWYAGLTLRHMAFDYFSEATLRRHHPNIFLSNRKTRQTDLKGTLAWRNVEPNRDNLIHPLDGEGLRLQVTGSEKVLGSQVQYARFSLDGYTVLPGVGDHRLYLYGNGIIDTGESSGRDYLNFADNGNYSLPEPDLAGSVNPGRDRFIRGFTEPLVGDRFLFGALEYRIPFFFNTSEKFLELIPPARTSLTLFADGGVMGDARIAENEVETRYRYSTGVEIKRVFSFGGSFPVVYELGIAQPLNQSLSPQPYFNFKAALPF